MNVDLSGERLVEMESSVIPINEQVVIAEGNRKLPATLNSFANSSDAVRSEQPCWLKQSSQTEAAMRDSRCPASQRA